MDQTHTFIKDLVMSLSVSPAVWQTFINKVLDEIPDRKHCPSYSRMTAWSIPQGKII